MSLSWVEHKGVSILHVDYRDCQSPDDMLGLLAESVQVEIANPGIREIGDFRGATVSFAYIDEITRYGLNHRKKYINKCAVLGLRGVKKFIYKTYLEVTRDKSIKDFHSFDEALDWLVLDGFEHGGNPHFLRQSN